MKNAVEFAGAWVAAWNRRDVEAVLDHFHDDAVFSSPVAQLIGFSESGVVRGKEELRRYWTVALAGNPDLHFDITGVFEGIDMIAIAFRTQAGVDRLEILSFAGGLVAEGRGTFAVT